MAAFEGTTSGRTARVCGQMAATTMASTLGTTIGPPADSAYAVEPVGVATTIPSAEYCPTSSPSTDTRSRITRATPPLCTTRSEEHTSELQSRLHLVCRLLLEKKKNTQKQNHNIKQKTNNKQ